MAGLVVLVLTKFTKVLLQFRLLETVAEAPGGVLFKLTVDTAVLVQPFVPVTSRLYVPGTVINGLGRVEIKPFGPVQEKPDPPVGEAPLRAKMVSAQVIAPLPAEAPGAALFATTVATPVLVHPVVPSVTTST